jgi:hypothetical protein
VPASIGRDHGAELITAIRTIAPVLIPRYSPPKSAFIANATLPGVDAAVCAAA